jgi:hypothetical protein
MAAYIKPSVLVYQEYQAVPTAITAPMRAHISGGHAKLHRYSQADEKANINIGAYDPSVDKTYAWPLKVAGSKVDQAYTKLFIDGALLLYFSDLVGAGSTVAPVSGYKNRVRSTGVSFKDNGDYARDTDLLRDVKLGDTVYLRGSDGSDTYELWSYVKGFKGEAVASSRGSATDADSNKADQSIATSIDYIAGAHNNIVLTADGTSYDGLADGDIDETYTVEVISGSVGGDLTTARLRITSASGNDNVASKAPSAAGGSTAVGTRGLTVEFDVNASASGSSAAGLDDAAPNDLIPGQKWKVRVKQDYTAPTAASSGTYTGTWDTTYIAEVVTGGGYGDGAQIRVTTTTGVDVSGPTTIVSSGTSVAVGSKGVRIAFTGGTGLAKGDKWYIEVTAASEGAMQTLVLGHNIPDAISDATDLDLKLFIKKDIQVSKNRTGFAPITNWDTSDTEFSVTSGLIAYDESWVDDSGDEVALDVVGGTMYLEFREWLVDFVGIMESLSDAGDVESSLGTIHPDNPLAEGVFKALANSNGSEVRFTAVADPDDLSSWSDVVQLLGGREDIYTLVPLTHDREVQNLFAAHIIDSSGPEVGQWRAGMFNIKAESTKAIANAALASDTSVVLASLSDDPDTTGTQYTLLQVTSDNAELELLGVRAGDVVRYLYTTDGFGSEEYTEFVIDEVVNETTVRLATGHTVAVSTPQKVEIWRNLKKPEIATNVGFQAGSFNSNRICVIWPDVVSSAGTSMPGYFLCAALAGLRSGVVPHQGLTNVEIQGFDDISRTTQFFNNSDLDTMAGAGVWVVTQALDGTVYSRHAVTTDNTDVNHREEMVRANVDSMSFLFLNNLKPFIGRANVTPSALTIIRVQLEAAIEYLKANGYTDTLGSQLIDGEITELRQHALLKDRIVSAITLTIPYPMNNIEVHLVI